MSLCTPSSSSLSIDGWQGFRHRALTNELLHRKFWLRSYIENVRLTAQGVGAAELNEWDAAKRIGIGMNVCVDPLTSPNKCEHQLRPSPFLALCVHKMPQLSQARWLASTNNARWAPEASPSKCSPISSATLALFWQASTCQGMEKWAANWWHPLPPIYQFMADALSETSQERSQP